MEITPCDPVEYRLSKKYARLKKVLSKKQRKVKKSIKLIPTQKIPHTTKPSKCKTPEDVIENYFTKVFNESFPNVLLIEPICSTIKGFLISKETSTFLKASGPYPNNGYEFMYPKAEWIGPKTGVHVYCGAPLDIMRAFGICITTEEKKIMDRKLEIKEEEKRLTEIDFDEFTTSQEEAIETLLRRGMCDYSNI